MKFLSFKKNYAAVLITLMILLFLGAVYFFIYVPQNEARLQEQRFQSLLSIEKNIHEKIANSVALLNNLLKDTVNAEYIEHLNRNSSENFSLALQSQPSLSPMVLKEITDSVYSVGVNNTTRQIILLLEKHNVQGVDTLHYSMAMKFSFEQFFRFLLPENVFDHYIVFNNGEVVYETLPSGAGYMKDSLAGSSVSSVKNLTISGVNYKLFLQPVNFSPANEWVVSGLLSNKRYQQEKNQLPPNLILLLLTIALIIFVCFPWIKLYHMGNKDRLTTTDGISSVVVSMLLMSLLFFSFFKYNVFLRPGNSSDSKDFLAMQIQASLRNELNHVHKELNVIDSFVFTHPELFKDFSSVRTDSGVFSRTSLSEGLNGLLPLVKDTGINQIFWLNSNGDEIANWTTDGMNAPHGNFKDRLYFKNIISNRHYYFRNSPHKFYLDQVISWTNGKFASVLSMPSKIPGHVVAVSFNMKSLHGPVLTPGYMFAVIDHTGKVLYHSDASRNLKEDLEIEFSEKTRLRSLLEARAKGAFKTKYLGGEYNVTVEPLQDLPYSVVVFSDDVYKATRDMEIYSFTLAMLLLLFAFFIFQLFVIFLVSSRRSIFKKQSYNTSWIGPKTSSQHQYNIAIVFNSVIILFAVVFFHLTTFLTYIFILLFSVSFISVFLNALFARRYKRYEQEENFRFKLITISWLAILILIINVVAARILDNTHTLVFIGYELITIITGYLLFKHGKSLLQKVRSGIGERYVSKWDYVKSFTLMTLTRLIITSGIPIVFFYISSYNYEQSINTRYRQVQYANELLQKLPDKTIRTIKENQQFDRGYYLDGGWVKSLDVTTDTSVIHALSRENLNSREDRFTEKVLGLFRIKFTDVAARADKFYIAKSADSSIFYNQLIKDASKKNRATTTYRQTSVPGEYLVITSDVLNYKFPNVLRKPVLNGLLFWFLLFIALVIFYYIIYNIINKLFCVNLPDLSNWQAFDDKIINSEKVNNLLFVIGLPGSGKLNLIKEKIKAGEIMNDGEKLVYIEEDIASSNVFVADLINIPDTTDEEKRAEEWKKFEEQVFKEHHRLIIVNHFEYNIQDAVTNRIKLNFLERLMLANKAKIIILSTIHPVAFLDSVMEQFISTNKSVADKEGKSIPGEDLERWHVLLGHYRIVVYPIQEAAQGITDKTHLPIYKETQYTHFLTKVRQPMLEVVNELPERERAVRADELIFKLQVSSHYFYMYIWQSLTKEEKFLLYDLAEDNLVNSFDDYNLNMLLAKGVIMRKDGTLRLFNKGFRNFILTAIGNTEAMKIKNRIQDNGNWSRLKAPLMIVLIAILTFLLASRQEAYSKLIAYVATLTAAIPAILKVFSFFDKSSQKE